MDALYQELKKYGTVKQGAPLAKFTTFKIGGPAQFLVTVGDTQSLTLLLKYLVGEGVEYSLLGGGSNLLWSDDPYDGVVIKLETRKIVVANGVLEVEAGAPLALVVATATQNALSGLEWAAGVPGTVGGAVRGNAGAMDSDTAQTLLKVQIWRDGEVFELTPEECGFGYRDSLFKHDTSVVLKAWYKTMPGDKGAIQKKIAGYIQQRNGKYPPFPSAGSFFKNIPFAQWPGPLTDLPAQFAVKQQVPAGWINEQNGLKGYQLGGAMVSKEHGNFLINAQSATEQDVLLVVEEVQRRAYTRFGVVLTPEVHIQSKKEAL